MSKLKTFIKLSQGNPGAMQCIAELQSDNQSLDTGASMMERAEILKYIDEHSILGTNLYILYNDLCDRNLHKMYHLISTAPVDEIKDAASRQDYSGRKLIEPYLDAYAQNNAD